MTFKPSEVKDVRGRLVEAFVVIHESILLPVDIIATDKDAHVGSICPMQNCCSLARSSPLFHSFATAGYPEEVIVPGP